jgi:hypothetical protein
MGEFHRHPDGHVYVRTSDGEYADSLGNFILDSGTTLPPMPIGADDQIYIQGKRHAFTGDGNIVEGGPMPWPLGDQIISDVKKMITAQVERRDSEEKTSAALVRDAIPLPAYAATKRWERETGGIALPDGYHIATDPVAQSKIAAAKTAFDNGAISGPIDFKMKDGWVSADADMVTAIYSAVVVHVQMCYAKEREVAEAIANGKILTKEEIDKAFSSLG